MKVFMTAMMLWISQHTGYTIPELPAVSYLSPLEIKKFAYGCDNDPVPTINEDICSVQRFWDLDEMEREAIPLGLYNHENNEIIVRKGFDIETIHDQSVLFHELVHHMQFHNGEYEKVHCTGQLEKLAYKLQDKWLQEKYKVSVNAVIGVNELFLMLVTGCPDPLHGVTIPDPEYQNQN